MVKSPEEYLSSMSFDTETHANAEDDLTPGERAFIEKYIGLDALKDLKPQNPESVLLPAPELAAPLPLPVKEPEIIVIPQTQLIVKDTVPNLEADKEEKRVQDADSKATHINSLESPARAPAIQKLVLQKRPEQEIIVSRDAALVDASVEAPAETELAENRDNPVASPDVASALEDTAIASKTDMSDSVLPDISCEATIDSDKAEKGAMQTAPVISRADSKVSAPQPVIVSPETLLREKMRQAAEVQVVSFYVAGQLFLLPVEGIQEVVRHMELIKVPQPPDYIAGAINLRGTVMPLVRLSALLTNEPEIPYDKNNFVIITGTEQLRMGLIIDKVKSMHMIPQKKIIWNAESKLGDSAEFLSAIVDLDDRVCGMVAPENIVQKILPEL